MTKYNEQDASAVYADIIHLSHWRSQTRAPMTPHERAAQFSPFAALTGYEDMVKEEAREVGKRKPLSESEMDILNQKLCLISGVIADGKEAIVTITYFVPDKSKNGGAYVKITEKVRRIDQINHKIELAKRDGLSKSYMTIDMDDIKDISGKLVGHIE